MMQLFYDAVGNVLDCHNKFAILEELLNSKGSRQLCLSREFVENCLLAFTHLTFTNAEKMDILFNGEKRNRCVTLPELYALNREDVILLNFQYRGRLFVPRRTYTTAFAYGFKEATVSGGPRLGPIFGLGYDLEEIGKLEKDATPVLEIAAEIHSGEYFFNKKEQQGKMPYTFLSITELKVSEEVYRKRNPKELFYRTLKEEYRAYLTSLLEREKEREKNLTKKIEGIEE